MKAKGITLPRPVYGGSSKKEDDKDEDASDADEADPKAATDADEDEEPVKSSTAGKLDKFKHKANHEATSEEDN